MTTLTFPDPHGYADLVTLVRRALRADPEAAVRLHATGHLLRAWVAVLPGTGLFGAGAALGVRGLELAEPAGHTGEVDVVCAAAALADRFARDGVGATRLSVPPATVYAAWSGSLPAHQGWVAAGQLDALDLQAIARAGIEQIATATRANTSAGPAQVGARAVAELRSQVWGRPIPAPAALDPASLDPAGLDPAGLDPAVPDGVVPAGAAFAAYVLGFLPTAGGVVRVLRNGAWVRLSTQAGDVLSRP